MTADRRPLTTRNARWAQGLAAWLAARRASPNGISIAGMGFATAGAGCYVASCRFCPPMPLFLIGAAISVQARLLCNMLDGLVAVEGGLKGKAGDLFNEAPDRYEDVVLLAAAGFAAGSFWLGWMAAAFAVLTAYVRAFGASLGRGQDFCGPFAKPHRMFFLTVGTLGAMAYLPFLGWTLWLIALGSLFTAARRVLRLYRKLP
jgi:phosphatidylglycerophosphate synthase